VQRNENHLNLEIALGRFGQELIGMESGIHGGGLSALPVAYEIAEIAIPAQMELHKISAVVGVFKNDHLESLVRKILWIKLQSVPGWKFNAPCFSFR
jgi:hypothetical protein